MKLGLLIDLDTCVGCHACAVACKEWNARSAMAGGAPDYEPSGQAASGVWYNRIRQFEIGDVASGAKAVPAAPAAPSAAAMKQAPVGGGHWNLSKTLNVPMSCMHCEQADCVTVCPTGASYKRAEDGIVLVDPDKCMGCSYCAWACPYGARELDEQEGVMRKCTLCVDRIYDQSLPEAERQPACVLACPAHARAFGDYDDPNSEVSQRAAGRERVGMLEQLDYKPLNFYLAPRPAPQIKTDAVAAKPKSTLESLKGLVNRLVSL
ncbi:MAG: 4Fe-4S dicluster domain-containing protein [Burkholderiaceae bacterium]